MGTFWESTLPPEIRRAEGVYYTSLENIHKVIDPLFLDRLKQELAGIKGQKPGPLQVGQVIAFQKKLAHLIFLDPACGSGNFLIETYLSLRRIENELLRILVKEKNFPENDEDFCPILVSLDQFYGIELDHSAVVAAKKALEAAESQMLRETEEIIQRKLPCPPRKDSLHLVEGNALRCDWNAIALKEKLNYIIGNPPFVGYSYQTKEQKADVALVMPNGVKNVDYVTLWFYKAARSIQNTSIRVAFVSTNSITQGEQVTGVWKPLWEQYHLHIDFAYRTFCWNSEAPLQAHVHCVIIGFSVAENTEPKRLYDKDEMKLAETINPYLTDGPAVFMERRRKPIARVPKIFRGSQPSDGGHLLFTEEEKDAFLVAEPQAGPFIRPFMNGKDFINRKARYCLWLVDADPAELKSCPGILERVEKVRAFRRASSKAATRRKADTPALFDQIHLCPSDYLAFPKVSTANRRYLPFDYLKSEVIPGDLLFVLPDATLYRFGILTSSVHLAWMRAVGGRMKSDYRYSNTIVYNNFPWPKNSKRSGSEIEQTAREILSVRAMYSDRDFNFLYDDITMPPDLRNALQRNDQAVMKAYEFKPSLTEQEIVAELMKRYQVLTHNP